MRLMLVIFCLLCNSNNSNGCTHEEPLRQDHDLQCAICLDVFSLPVTLNCKHNFCYTCIARWQETRAQCPLCREKIQYSKLNQELLKKISKLARADTSPLETTTEAAILKHWSYLQEHQQEKVLLVHGHEEQPEAFCEIQELYATTPEVLVIKEEPALLQALQLWCEEHPHRSWVYLSLCP